MGKYTKGPWCYEHCGEKCTDIFIGTAHRVDDKKDAADWEPASGRLDATDDEGNEVEYCREGVAYIDDTCSAGQHESNARLIAASPTLYEALNDLMPWLQSVMDSVSGKERDEYGALIVKARAALAKANEP